ncbi:MAG: two-component regulator propeller domain-containing protein [Chitinophagaceae bacterium]
MKVTNTIISIILLQAIFCGSAAQDNTIKFNLVEGNNGEPLGNINGITQDPYGYMWFAGQQANCLYKYDGNRMISFRHDSLDANSLGGPKLETVYADNTGMIWVGFFDGGLDKLNPATGHFTHYRHLPNDQGSLSPGMVNVILRDHKGALWIGTANGLDRFDETAGKFIHYKNEPFSPSSLSSNVVRALYEDHKGTLWVGTGFPFDKEKPDDGGLNRMEPNGTFIRFMHDPNNPHSLINNKVRSIFEDSRGIFWIGTAGDGLHTMNRATGFFERHLYDPGKPDKLSRPPLKPGAWYDHITFIKEDGSGAIWMGTYAAGINRYDPVTQKITHYESSNGYPDKSGWVAYTSADGVLWLSAQENTPNLYRVDPSLKSFKNNIAGNRALSFHEDPEGFLWVGFQETGLQKYDQKRNLIYSLNYGASDSGRLVDNQIFAIFQNQPDTFWLSTIDGVVLLNKKTGRTSLFHYKGKDDIKSNKFEFSEVKQIIQDKKGLKWFATLAGLIQYNPKNNSAKKYLPDLKDNGAISSDRITSVVEDRAGYIWAGAYVGGGVNRLDIQREEHFRHYLRGFNIICLYEDAAGTVWAGTEKGLYRYNKEVDNFAAFFDSQSDVRTAIINGIIEDDGKNLWVSTQSAIVKLNPARTGNFIYGKKFGIQTNSLIRGGIYKTTKGEILIGHKNGFYSFYPGEFAPIDQSSKTIITNLVINSLPVWPGKGSVLSKPIEETNNIVLPYSQNNLSFQFAAIDYRAPEMNKYYVMMDGYDNNWREATADKSAYYLNVPFGSYAFRVKSFNSDGIQAEKTIKIIIKPPWWKTWWAYLLYALLFIVFISGTYRYQKKRIVHKEIEKAQKKELAHAKEIEKAYKELKTTQAQLIQAEKMASLGELTAGIAHEIQNPLNFVNNFSELSNELVDEMNEDLDRGEIQEAKVIASNIKKNLEKINHHGKRADAIVKGMLQHSQSSTGHIEPVDINKLAEEYVRLAYHGIRAKDKSFNATLKTDFDETIGKINIIPQDIGRVILNLINNAFYAVDEKRKQSAQEYEPTVSVSTKKMGDKPDSYRIEIVVKDNGNGIPQKIVDKIFQPFFTTKPTGQGTGLGLSLAYDIVKAHGGELKVETKEGEGSGFIIALSLL